MKHRLCKITALFVLFTIGGFLVAASGVIPIKASSGHWSITAWFLHFAMRRSIITYTLGLEAPALDEPSLVLKGAGHYEAGCYPCHGSPELQSPRIARAMTPAPPYLPPRIAEWEPEELFYIVKHGVKFTGMPSWPALERDDEVWAMVAFLLKLPELKAEKYRQLVNGEAAANGEIAPIRGSLGPEKVPRAITTSCARCHGVNGLGRSLGAFPKLAGQRFDYLDLSLQAFARGQRRSGIMEPIAAGLSQKERSELARYYASLPKPLFSLQRETSAVERGRAITQRGLPSQRVPACAPCHGPSATRRNPVYPELAGQFADYLVLQLELFKKERRGGTDYAHIMRRVVAGLTTEQMRDVALYYESLTSQAVR